MGSRELSGGMAIGLIGGIVLLAIVAAIVCPFIIIWAVNTLFGLEIAYTFWNWLAALALLALFGRGGSTSSSK